MKESSWLPAVLIKFFAQESYLFPQSILNERAQEIFLGTFQGFFALEGFAVNLSVLASQLCVNFYCNCFHYWLIPHPFARQEEYHENGSNVQGNFEVEMESVQSKNLIYCDPPYSHTQAILYGAQSFSLVKLFDAIARCKARGVSVAVSIDGTKRSGNLLCELPIPDDLFQREAFIDCGRSMLRRFQMDGQTLEGEVVTDRLLLTY